MQNQGTGGKPGVFKESGVIQCGNSMAEGEPWGQKGRPGLMQYKKMWRNKKGQTMENTCSNKPFVFYFVGMGNHRQVSVQECHHKGKRSYDGKRPRKEPLGKPAREPAPSQPQGTERVGWV